MPPQVPSGASVPRTGATIGTETRNATTILSEMEQQSGQKAHFLARHGEQVTTEQLQERALTGRTPDGFLLRPENSTRWLNNDDMLDAIQQAQSKWKGGDMGLPTKPGVYQWDTGRNIGEGYFKNSGEYGSATNVEIRLNPSTGKPITAFPILAPKGAK